MPEHWVYQLKTWTSNGTFDRLDAAKKAGQPVAISRSDGSTSIGVIHGTGGFGGRTLGVRIDCDPPLYKQVDTDDFLELNPGFGPSLKTKETGDA